MVTVAAASASSSVPVWLAIAAAAIGAGGAVLAQVVAQAFAAHRESRRFKWDKERKLIEDEQARHAQLLDLRMRLFTRFAAIHRQRIESLQWSRQFDFHSDDLVDPNKPTKEERHEALLEFITARKNYESDLKALLNELSIVAPRVSPAIVDTSVAVDALAWVVGSYGPAYRSDSERYWDDAESEFAKCDEAFGRAADLMRKELGLIPAEE